MQKLWLQGSSAEKKIIQRPPCIRVGIVFVYDLYVINREFHCINMHSTYCTACIWTSSSGEYVANMFLHASIPPVKTRLE